MFTLVFYNIESSLTIDNSTQSAIIIIINILTIFFRSWTSLQSSTLRLCVSVYGKVGRLVSHSLGLKLKKYFGSRFMILYIYQNYCHLGINTWTTPLLVHTKITFFGTFTVVRKSVVYIIYSYFYIIISKYKYTLLMFHLEFLLILSNS